MSKQEFPLRTVAIAAIAAAALSLPMMSAAQAQTDIHKTQHRRIYNTTQDPAALRPAPRITPSNTPAYEDYLTWPEGSPSYHGGNG